MAEKPDVVTARRQRGVIRGSITRLERRLKALELKDEVTTGDISALQRMKTRLSSLDEDFRRLHFVVVEVADEDDQEVEQTTIDEHDDRVAEIMDRIEELLLPPEVEPAEPSTDSRLILQKRLQRIQRATQAVADEILPLRIGTKIDVCLVRQQEECIAEIKAELNNVLRDILSSNLDEDEELSRQGSDAENLIFKVSLHMKRLLYSPATPSKLPPTPDEPESVKLPTIEVPMFDGNILNWKEFWGQFDIAVHQRKQLSDAGKLAYLKHALKDGPAKYVVEGLSGDGASYAQAIECLLKRYDRPRLIHKEHVRAILEATPIKEGNGKELRRLHDTASQHLRALKVMEYESYGSFITSALELKLDPNTTFEWQKHTQGIKKVPNYQDFLDFLDLRARATESITGSSERSRRQNAAPIKKPINSRVSYAASLDDTCVACKAGKHPLYICKKFRDLHPEDRTTLIKENKLCLNCLKGGHFTNHCPSYWKCRKCQRRHHTLLHLPEKGSQTSSSSTKNPTATETVMSHHSRLAAVNRQVLLMTCKVLVRTSDGRSTVARALLDSAASSSFITERLAQHLRLPRQKKNLKITGICGDSQRAGKSIVRFGVARIGSKSRILNVEAVVLHQVTADLPLFPVSFDQRWKHLRGLELADPDYGTPGRIDILLGAEVFDRAVLHGRRFGPKNSPSAWETCFGWVLTGGVRARSKSPTSQVISCCALSTSGDELLRKFWEVESYNYGTSNLSMDEKAVVRHFDTTHKRDPTGRYIVPLPKKLNITPLGESRTQAVKRFLALERSLNSRGKVQDFTDAMSEYFDMGHAEPVPASDLLKPTRDVFYMPMHAVTKTSSTTTKLRVVFDASAKSQSGTSLNDQLLVGPTVHPPLIDVLIRFRRHRVALTADVSRMYRAVLLPEDQRDLHRFVYRADPASTLQDLRMTRLTFGVSASSFAANMAVKQNAINYSREYPKAAAVVHTSFYVDDCITGSDSTDEAIELQRQLQDLFDKGGFILRKWKASDAKVLQHISQEMLDKEPLQTISDTEHFAKVLGLDWNADRDCFRITVEDTTFTGILSKRLLISNIARIYDVLGWCSPCTVKAKILLQRLWEAGLGWDDPVPKEIQVSWAKWREELPVLRNHLIPRCYFPKNVRIVSYQLHGFSDASELAYAGVVFLRMTDSHNNTYIQLVVAKTRVAPIKRITIPRLELCGAVLVARLLGHVKEILEIPDNEVYAWTDSEVVLGWLRGNPRRFKVFVGNRVSEIIELVPTQRWNHVTGTDNPADCASRGLYPSELIQQQIWWKGPEWLYAPHSDWPLKRDIQEIRCPAEERELETPMVVLTATQSDTPLYERISSYSRLLRITAWMKRFIDNCRCRRMKQTPNFKFLSSNELSSAENYWLHEVQLQKYHEEISLLQKDGYLPRNNKLARLRPFLDTHNLLRVGGRIHQGNLPYDKRHPIILPYDHTITNMIIRTEHERLLHDGPTSVAASLARRFHIVHGRNTIRYIIHNCVKCKRVVAKPRPQILGQLPIDRITPGHIFDRVGVDYAGPIWVKSGSKRKPTMIKAYACIFVDFTVKATHIEAVSDLTTAAFIAALRRFVARRGKPSVIWSDHGTNFQGAASELKELYAFLRDSQTQHSITNFCSTQRIEWKFIPERAPHFGGLWEAAVKSMKRHLKKVAGNVKLNFEELTTVLAQIEACMNSRPLTPLPDAEDNIEVLTPGHFLIGKPLEALPDQSDVDTPISTLRRWHLCQAIVQHFWKRWTNEYVSTLQTLNKWKVPMNNLQVGDIVCLKDETLAPTKWPLARIKEIFPGADGKVRVASVRTAKGCYKRPVTKIVQLLPADSNEL